jgi:hypothetical protein
MTGSTKKKPIIAHAGSISGRPRPAYVLVLDDAFG